MKSTTSVYYIEVKEGNKIKRVPHTKRTKHTEFFDRRKAIHFMNCLVGNNFGTSFRLCKETTTHTNEPWFNAKSEKGLTDKQFAKLK